MTAPTSNGGAVTVTVSNISQTSGILYIGEASTSYPVISTITVTTPASAATHTITLNANGGTVNGSATATEGSNTLTSITAPTYAGHTLVGYYEEAACTNLIADASGNLEASTTYTDASGNWTSTSDQTLYAKWLTDNDATFSNGSYTIGGSALDLSDLFSSTSDGAVTYTVTNANGTGATIASTSFTASTAGTATVKATQAATATYAGKEIEATISVYGNPLGSHTLTWNLNTNTTTLGTESKTSTSTYIAQANLSNLTANGPSASGKAKTDYTPIIQTLASYNANNYMYVTFTVADGYQFTPTSINVKVQPVSTDKDAKIVLTDGTNSIENTPTNCTQGSGTTISETNSGAQAFTGTVTLKIYCYGAADGYRLGTPITITGNVAAAATPSAPTAPTFTYDSTVRADHASIAGAHTGDIVTINAATGKYIYADWSSSTSQTKDYVFTDGKSRAQTTYQATISAGGTRVIYAVAGVNNDGTGASSDLTYIQFTGVTPHNPNFSVSEGSVAKNTSLTLTAGYNEDNIYYTYTTDGSEPADPTTSSTPYSSALNIFTADNTTYKIKAVAYDKTDANPSSVILKTYTTPAAASLAISTQPTGATYTQNESATALSVAATGGTGSYTYQWYSNTSNSTEGASAIGSATSASYTPSTTTVGTTYYYCVVSDGNTSVTSNIVSVVVNAAGSGSFYILNGLSNVPLTAGMNNAKYQVLKSDGSTVTATTDISSSITTPASYYYNSTSSAHADLTNTSNYSSGSSSNRTMQAIKLTSGSTMTIDIGSKIFSKMDVIYRCASTDAKSITIDGTAYNTSDKDAHLATITKTFNSDITISNSSGKEYDVLVILTESSATTYNITCAAELTNGSISAPASAAEGATVTVTATPATGYKLSSVTVTGATSSDNISTSGTGNTRTFTMPAENVNVTATFETLASNNVNIAYSTTPANGTLVASASPAQEGSTVTITATPEAGYRFASLSVVDGNSNNISVSGSGNTRTFTMPATAVTVTGNFVQLPRISTSATNGTVTTSPASYAAEGTTVTITATPNQGYSLADLTVMAGSTPVTVTDNQFTMPSTNVTVTATFVAQQISADERWNFTTMSSEDEAKYKADATNWSTSSGYFSNKFTANSNTASTYSGGDIVQIQGLKYIRSGSGLSSNNIVIYKPTSSADGYMKFNGGSGRGVVIPGSELTTGMQVNVEYEGGSASNGFTLTNAMDAATSGSDVTTITSATRTTATFYVKAGGSDIQMIANNSNIKLYKITLGSTETIEVAEPTFSPVDGTEQSTGTVAVTVTTNQTEGTTTTYYGFGTTAMTRDELVSGNKTTNGSSTVSPAATSENDIVISAVTKAVIDDKTYFSEVVTATYPYTGARSFSVSAPNLTIQQGDRQVVLPVISYPDGTAFNPADDDNNPTLQNLTDYFDFTFQKTTSVSEYVTVDGSTTAAGTTGEVNTKVGDNEAPTGTVETITITATKKSGFSGTWPFKNNGPVSTTITATVIAKAAALYMSFYWDPDFTVPVTSADYTQNGSVSVFNGVIPNGRMIYVKPADGYTVYVAAGSASETVSKVSGNSKKNGVCHYQYRNGCALQFEDSEFESGETEKDFYLNLATYNSSGVAEGRNVQSVFTLSSDNSYRPGNLTYDPADTTDPLSTAVTVAAIGTEGSYIFSKFSSEKTTYQTPNLINEDGIQVGVTSVGVFSTEVAKRKITGLQVSKNATDNYWYIGTQSGQTYTYTFATELTLKSNTLYTNVYTGTGTAETIDLSELIKSITYYNKSSKADIDITTAATKSGTPATQIETVTYDIEFRNGAGGEGVTNGTTLAGDVVTIGQKSGVAIVTITYPGGDYEKTVNSRTGVTAPAKATYTIYITDPNEQLPNITPTTRSFVDEQAVRIQAPTTWDVLYMVVEPGSTNYDATTATYVSEGDGKNCTLLKAGEFVMLTITNTSKVRAFAFDSNATTFTPGVSGTTSKEVYETYTKLAPLKAPLLNPYGEPHTRTTATLKVTMAAQDAIAGLEGYYTTDGTDPTPTTGERYNGAEGINISGASTTVKAIVYDPATGRISPVTTGVYLYTANIDKPIFYVSNDNGSTWEGGHSEGTVNVTGTSWIKIEGPTDSHIYYTLDGSTPTPGTSREFTTGEHFIIVKNNTTGKAIAIQNDATSPVTTVVFNLTDESQNLWEAVEETTPGGKMAADDRYVVDGKSTGNSSTKAVKYLTATFGGMDNTGWSHADISENTKGTPLDGVGSYSIRNIKDAWDESGKEPQNSSSLLHERTFKLPAQGDMVRFEPERDGRLTIWLLQQGGLNYTDDGEFCDAFIRLRPVYLLDEQGNAVEVSTTDGIKSSTRLSSNWDELKTGAWTPQGKTQNGVTNIYYDETQSTNIYNMYSNYLTTHEIGVGDAIEPFALTDATVKGYTGINGTGYVMPSGGYVRYTFDVKGGKSYYLYGFRTKLGVRGFRFKPTSETVAKSVTVADGTENMVTDITNASIAADEICNVTYSRKFTNGTWAAVTFPFSVSVAQMKKVFGDAVDVIHFENVSNSKINFKRHWYPMIVAGTPVLIKPSQDMGTSVTFEGVRIEAETVNEVSGEGGYKMTGSFTPGTIVNGDYYISGGKLAVRKSGDLSTKACRSWLTAGSSTGARFDLTMGTADAFAEEAWSVIGNPQPFVASDETVVTYINGVQEDGIINNIFDGPTGIYTINGQLIRKDATSLEGLSKGIYIVNGKKIAVK